MARSRVRRCGWWSAMRSRSRSATEAAMAHSLDTHAAQTPPERQLPDRSSPGEEFTWTFTPNYPGAFMYHCGTPPVLMHIGAGMYGAMIVDPKEGWPPAQELVFVQSEFYLTDGPNGVKTPDFAKLMQYGALDYVVFNGYANQYVEHPIPVKVGEPIRIFVVNAGPNIWSSFHVVGAIFDAAYVNANPANKQVGLRRSRSAPETARGGVHAGRAWYLPGGQPCLRARPARGDRPPAGGVGPRRPRPDRVRPATGLAPAVQGMGGRARGAGPWPPVADVSKRPAAVAISGGEQGSPVDRRPPAVPGTGWPRRRGRGAPGGRARVAIPQRRAGLAPFGRGDGVVAGDGAPHRPGVGVPAGDLDPPAVAADRVGWPGRLRRAVGAPPLRRARRRRGGRRRQSCWGWRSW